MRSVADHHPGWRRFVILVDQPDGYFDPEKEDFEIVLSRDLPIHKSRWFHFKYAVLELSTAVKPYAFEHLMRGGAFDRIVYLDADIPTDGAVTAAGFAVSNFNVPPTKGFHLAKVDGEQQAFAVSASGCLYGDVCEHVVEAPGTDEWVQAKDDWSYARCTRLHPSNQTCTYALDADGGPSSAASAQCQTLDLSVYTMSLGQMCAPGPEGSSGAFWQIVNFTANPSGLADPAIIDLGTTIWDAFFFFGFNPGLAGPP